MFDLTMDNLVLAQGETAAPALPGEAAGGDGTTAAPGTAFSGIYPLSSIGLLGSG